MKKETKKLIRQLKKLANKHNTSQMSIIDKIINKFILLLRKQTTYEGLYAIVQVNLFKTIEARELLIEYEKTLTNIFTNTIKIQGGQQHHIARLAPIFNENSTKYLYKYGDSLAQQINTIIKQGIDHQTPHNQVVKSVQTLLKNKKWESERIVRTETSNAVNTASYLQNKAEGKKYYNTDPRAEACKHCLKVHAEGPYPIEDKTHIPTLHPHCACIPVFYETLEEANEDKEYISGEIQRQREKIGEDNINDDGTSTHTNKMKPEERIWN